MTDPVFCYGATCEPHHLATEPYGTERLALEALELLHADRECGEPWEVVEMKLTPPVGESRYQARGR